MKIVFLESHLVTLNNDIDYSKLHYLGDYAQYELSLDDDPIPYAKGAEIVIVHKIVMSRERIKALLPELKLLCEAATGYNNIDIEAAKDFGVHVTNVPEYAKYSVTQQVFAYMLEFATKWREYDLDVKRGLWHKSKTFDLLSYPTFELYQKKIGIIGFGSIGQQIARVAEAFRMQVMAYDVVDVSKTGYRNYTLDEVLSQSDFIIVQCPLTDSTRNLIDKNAFNKMKRTAILINASRGGIVNEEDLAEALNTGRIAGAAVDVLSKEPPEGGNVLLDSEVKNLIVTPHTAWSTVESRQRLVDKIADDIKAFLEGKLTDFIV